MQPGSRGVTSLGDGEVRTIGPSSRFAFSFYAAGPLKTYPATTTGDFAMYWLTPPTFDTTQLAQGIQKLYAYMSKFFRDEGQPYRVFIRRNPHRSGGGTALPGSFMFGWNEATAPNAENLQSLLAHEMTHNWPDLDGEHGDTAWYSEGAAEFYSIVLSYRAGVLSTDQFLKAINARASGYYTNPYLRASNREAAEHFWNDWSAQRVPYGRGFMYLTQVDAKIRAKTSSKHSLDEIVVALYDRRKKAQPRGIDLWLELVAADLGDEAKRDYDAMVAGTVLVPPENAFGPCFKPAKHRERPYILGFDQASLSGERKVIRGMVAGSAAATAGLREGDVVVEADDVLEVQKDSENLMKLKVKRGDNVVAIEYLPRGEPIDSYRWERVSSVPDTQCRI